MEKWQGVQKGALSMEVLLFDNRVVDVRWWNKTLGTITVSIDQGFERWCLVCLGIWFILLLSTMIISNSASLFDDYGGSDTDFRTSILRMKLLPLGRKNIMYIIVFGLLVGAGTLLVDYFSALVNFVLLNLEIDDELHNPPGNYALVRECKVIKYERVYIGSRTGGKTEDFMAAAKVFLASAATA